MKNQPWGWVPPMSGGYSANVREEPRPESVHPVSMPSYETCIFGLGVLTGAVAVVIVTVLTLAVAVAL